ncbi:MAG: J domain-containing protein [Chitinispirillaceae bacterium]|nr:J domain-containing protein [Chitinispirillaceae bacterium]
MKLSADTNRYERLCESRKILGIGEEATVNEIKKAFHDLILRWHPDKVQGAGELHREKTYQITNAYKTIMEYCAEYKIPFSREVISRYCSEEEFWRERFGNDQLWGGPGWC